MPTAPTITGATVRPTPSRADPPLQRPQDLNIAAVGRGLINASNAIERANLQISQIRVSEAETEILNRWNARLSEDDDAYFKLGGRDAVDGLDSYLKEQDDIANEVLGTLKTGAEKRLLTNAIALRRMNNRTKMSFHSFNSRQQWDKDTAIANRKAQIESVVNDPSPENLTISRERIIDETDAISKIDGLPPEAAKLNAETAVSEMYRTAIETVIASERPFLAKEMLERYGDQIQAEAKNKLRERLNELTLASESRDLANDASQHSDNVEEQLKFIKKKYGANPSARQTEIIERASQKAVTARAQIETAQSIARSENFNFLGERVIAATQGGASGIRIIEALQGAFPDRFEGEVLTTSQRAQLNNLANVGQPNQTTPEGMMTYLRIMELAATNPSVLADLEPADYLGTMSSKEFDRVEKAINEAKGAGITTETAALASRQKTLNIHAMKNDIDLSQDELSNIGLLLQREAIERLDEFKAVQKREPTEKEWLDIIDAMFIKVLLDDPREPVDLSVLIGGPPQDLSVIHGGPERPSPTSVLLGGDPESQFAFTLQISDVPRVQRRIVEADFRARNNGRDALPNELETHFIALMADPTTRQILLGN